MPKSSKTKKSKAAKAGKRKKTASKSKSTVETPKPTSIPSVGATFTRPQATGAVPAVASPVPQLCPKGEVGNVVQDFIDFGGATAVTSAQQPDGQWLVQSV